MRIVTVAMPAASTPAEVYAHADADALLAMLVHKIGQVVMQQGVEQGQGLLQDWLVLFVAAYNQHRGLQPKSPQEVRSFSLVRVCYSLQSATLIAPRRLKRGWLQLCERAHETSIATHH